MKQISVILSLLCCCSCERFLDGLGSGNATPAEPVQEKALFMSGLEYPEGYDWKRDTAYGTVRCTLFLMKNGERILERPVGYAHSTASDSDMHRIVVGQLFEDFPSGNETVICRNGELLWKWSGNMMVNDMIACGRDIYTLTSPRKGKGYVLHRNEETIVESKDGSPASGLAADNGQVFFSIIDDTGKWKLVFKGKAFSIDTGIWKVCQVSLAGGTIRAICESNGNIAYHFGGRTMDINSLFCRFSNLDLADINGDFYAVSGPADNSLTGEKGYCVLKQDGEEWYDEENFVYCSSCRDAENLWILGFLPNNQKYVLLHEGEITELPNGYVPAPGKTLAMTDQGLSVSLTRDGKAAVWIDGSLTDYSFNGYIDNIY